MDPETIRQGLSTTEEIAKTARPAVEVAVEYGRAAGLDAVQSIGGLFGDVARAVRSVSLAKLCSAVERAGGRDALETFKRLSPEGFFDTIEKATRVQDETLLELWARLTTSAAEVDALDSPMLRATLAGLSPADANLLAAVAEHDSWMEATRAELTRELHEKGGVQRMISGFRCGTELAPNRTRLAAAGLVHEHWMGHRFGPVVGQHGDATDAVALTAYGRQFSTAVGCRVLLEGDA